MSYLEKEKNRFQIFLLTFLEWSINVRETTRYGKNNETHSIFCCSILSTFLFDLVVFRINSVFFAGLWIRNVPMRISRRLFTFNVTCISLIIFASFVVFWGFHGNEYSLYCNLANSIICVDFLNEYNTTQENFHSFYALLCTHHVKKRVKASHSYI